MLFCASCASHFDPLIPAPWTLSPEPTALNLQPVGLEYLNHVTRISGRHTRKEEIEGGREGGVYLDHPGNALDHLRHTRLAEPPVRFRLSVFWFQI